MKLYHSIGRKLAAYLSRPGVRMHRPATCLPDVLAASIRKGDVLLVEGSSRFSTAVMYLTQSTWSHAALCVRDITDNKGEVSGEGTAGVQLIEADVSEGVRLLPLSDYEDLHTRICRPVGLNEQEIDAVVSHTVQRIGHQYDLRNILDLTRYLVQTPPIPRDWRRRFLALGSGDPTRAICSTLIAEAFQSIGYPILPEIQRIPVNSGGEEDGASGNRPTQCQELLHIRHYSLFAPRDFDISPYFEIIKPTISWDFSHKQLSWAASETQHSK